MLMLADVDVDGGTSSAMLMLYQIAVIGLSSVIHLQTKQWPGQYTRDNDLRNKHLPRLGILSENKKIQ